MSDYYDWKKTFTYDADVTMVIGERGVGKTYGLRRQLIDDYEKRKETFVCVCRTKESKSTIARGYFSKVCEVDEEIALKYEFKSDSSGCFIRRKDEEKKDRLAWERIGYFVAMSQFGLAKETTFERVRRIVLDEGVIEQVDRYHKYLSNEWYVLSSIVNSCARETGKTRKHKPNVYILGNACDLINPYFIACGIDDVPPFGKSWYRNKTFLLDYIKPDKGRSKRIVEDTVAGRMMSDSDQANVYVDNEFANADKKFVAQKPKRAKYSFAIVSKASEYGVWLDKSDGYYYVTGKVPKDYAKRGNVCALTVNDMRKDTVTGMKVRKYLRTFFDLYGMGIILFDSIATRESFLKDLALFGIR